MENDLKERLLNLDLISPGKMELWLTYKKAKQVSSIATKGSHPNLEGIYQWITDAGMKYKANTTYASKETPAIIVSYNPEFIKEIDERMKEHTKENTLRNGELYGYPREATEQILNFWQNTDPVMKSGRKLALEGFGDEFLYAGYMLRVGHEKEDVKPALKWAKIIREDIPELAKEFEKEVREAS